MSKPPHRLYSVLRGAIACLLFTAAGLKTYEAMRTGSAFTLTDLVQVELEAALALWLISGWWLRTAWWTTLIVFVSFVTYSIYGLIIGRSDCGCFGPLATPPWVMLMLNGAIIALLLVFRPRKRHVMANRLPRTAVAALALATLPLLAWMSTWQLEGPATTLSAKERLDGLSEAPGHIDPQAWPGKDLPLLKWIDINDRLSSGHWQVMFYRHDCTHCHEQLDAWLAQVVPLPTDDKPHLALIEIPPYGELTLVELAKSEGWHHGRLSNDHHWHFQSPQFVELRNGVAKQVKQTPITDP